MDTEKFGDFFYIERNEEYLRLLKEEEEYWDASLDSLDSEIPPDWVQEHQNERFTGDRNRKWYQAIDDYGPFHQACSLGAGPGEVESSLLRNNPDLSLIVYDISGDSLGRLRARLDPEFPGRTEVRREDLNFLELAPEAFDLIVSQSSIHHLLNLEHVAFQINRALAPGGYFFLRDTVGESYLQFSDEKKRLYEALVQATSEGLVRFDWPDRNNWKYSPFEAARSGEILEVLERYLRLEELRTANSIMEMNLFVRRAPPIELRAIHLRALRLGIRTLVKLYQKFLGPLPAIPQFAAGTELMILLDGICSDSGYFRPGLAFARYRKRSGSGPVK